jgi:hypothetical protein
MMRSITIKKADKKQAYSRKLEQVKMKGLDAKKYCGKLIIREDPVKLQRRLRDEWE